MRFLEAISKIDKDELFLNFSLRTLRLCGRKSLISRKDAKFAKQLNILKQRSH